MTNTPVPTTQTHAYVYTYSAHSSGNVSTGLKLTKANTKCSMYTCMTTDLEEMLH